MKAKKLRVVITASILVIMIVGFIAFNMIGRIGQPVSEMEYFDNLSDEVSSKIVMTSPVNYEYKKEENKKSDSKARVTSKGVLGIVSGKINGATVANADPQSKGGFSSDLDAMLAGTGGLKQGGRSGIGRAGAAGIGFGTGFGSGFGGGNGGVGDLIGGKGSQSQTASVGKVSGIAYKKSSAQGSNTQSGNFASCMASSPVMLKKRGQIKAASPSSISGDGNGEARSKEAIRRVVMKRIGGLKYLYNKELKQNPNLDGKLTVKMVIAPSGTVIRAQILESSLNTPELEKRIQERIKGWKFGEVPKGTSTVIYPFSFDDGDGVYSNNTAQVDEVIYPRISSQYVSEKEELKFIKTTDNSVSTFSIDVDKGAYSLVRNYINQGLIPPSEIVRTEEMINYFNYSYAEPKGDDPVSINSEVGKCPWNENNLLVKVGLKAKSIKQDNIPNSNFVFLIDVSGSMSDENKLPLLKRSFKLLSESLRKEDRVSIVVYAGAAGVVLKPTSGLDKNSINDAFDNLSAGGSTAGGEGIMMAYQLARENFIKGGNNRVILATDGDFNVGVSSDDDLIKLIKERRDDGIFLTVMGFGSGNYQDKKMEQLANKGNGNYYYIDSFLEAKKTLQNEFMGTMFTVAKDVKLQLEFNSANVSSYRLIGYNNRVLARQDFNDDKKDAGEMGAGHTVTALYEVVPNNNEELRYANNNSDKELVYLKLRYKEPDEDKSKLMKHYIKTSALSVKKSDDFNFAASVVAFAEILRNRDIGNYNYSDVETLARASKGVDENGYRAEFINLVRQYPNLHNSNNNRGYRNQNEIINTLQRELFDKINRGVKKGSKLLIGDNIYSKDFISFVITSKGEVTNITISGDIKKASRRIKDVLQRTKFSDTPFGKDEVKVPVVVR